MHDTAVKIISIMLHNLQI